MESITKYILNRIVMGGCGIMVDELFEGLPEDVGSDEIERFLEELELGEYIIILGDEAKLSEKPEKRAEIFKALRLSVFLVM